MLDQFVAIVESDLKIYLSLSEIQDNGRIQGKDVKDSFGTKILKHSHSSISLSMPLENLGTFKNDSIHFPLISALTRKFR